jgi:hypothetical protein
MKKNDTSLFKKIEDLLPEELEEMEKREAELEAKYRNEDLAEIKGRCAKCTDKCIWYRQRKIELNIQ